MNVDQAVEEYVKWVKEAEDTGTFTPAYCAGAALCGWEDSHFRYELLSRHPDIPKRRMDHDRIMWAKRRADLTARLEEQLAAGKTRAEAADIVGMSRQNVAYYVPPSFKQHRIDWDWLWADVRPKLPMRLDAIRVMYGFGKRAGRYQFDAGLQPSWLGRRLEKVARQGRPAWVCFDKEAE